MPSPIHTDVLIVIQDYFRELDLQKWRRKIVVSKADDFPQAIRRAVQEGVKKSPDMLLPIIGFKDECRKDLLSIDTRYYQGVIYLSKKISFTGGPLNELYCSIANSINGLAVSESVYLRYKNLCDQLKDIESIKDFLSFCLYDGVIFDVRD